MKEIMNKNIFILLFLMLAISFSNTNMALSAADIGPNHEPEAKTENDDTSTEKNTETSDNTSKIGISEAIPVDEILDTWQKEYSDIMTKWGLGNTAINRIITTSIIVIIGFFGFFIAKKLSSFFKNRIQGISKGLTISKSKMSFYESSIYWLLIFLLLILSTTAILSTWNISLNDYISDDFIVNTLANILTVYIIIIGGSIFIELICSLIEKLFKRWGNDRQARTETLLPIARNTVYAVFVSIFSLMLLSEIGINVMPLLAGAGVLGFAVGFGAQTIIKDLLTGFIIILEDLIQVGDIVTLAQRTGVIEKITIRKVQLRDLSGTVYTVPFSEISIVENLTKEFSYSMFEVGVAYGENIDDVCELLKEIDSDLRSDDNYSKDMLSNIEILGLDKFADSAVIIKARIKTNPSQQWRITREFNRRMKFLFDKNNIEIPFPHQTIYFGKDTALPIETDKNEKKNEDATTS